MTATERALDPTSPAALPTSAPSRRQLLLLIGALSAFGPLSIDMYLPGLPDLRQDFSTGASQTQLTLSGCLLGLALGQLLAGPISDALGRRRPLLVGLTAYAISSLLCAIAPSVFALVGFRFVQGCAGAAGIVIARSIVRDLYTGVAAARFFSLLMLVSGLAPILAPIFGGQLLRVGTWRFVFVTLAIIGALLFLASATTLRETLPPDRRQAGGLAATGATFRRLLADRVFLGYALSCGLAFAAMFSYISGSPFVVQDIYGASPQRFSFFFGLNAAGYVLCGQINGRLVGRVPLRRLLSIGLCVNTTGGLTLLAVVLIGGIGLPGILPAFFLIVASIGLIMPNATALALADHPRTAGSASAVLGVLQYAVGAAAAPLVGIAGEDTATPLALVIAFAGLAALSSFFVLTRPSSLVPRLS